MTIDVKIVKLYEDVKTPEHATLGSSGVDFYARLDTVGGCTQEINADGTYVIHGLEPGSYWVKNNNGDTVYWEEYYRSERSVHFIECPLAEAVSVVQGITTPAINFQLDVDTAGDIDLDGTRDLRDLILALQIAAGESVQLDEAAAEHADFDGNGRIGIHEVIMLLNVLADR